MVEVVRVVGPVRRAVHRAAVGDDEQDAALLATALHALAGPVDRLAVDAFAEQVGLQQRGDVAAGAPPRRVGGLEHQVADLVQPPRVARPPGALPVALRAPAVPRTGGEAEDFAADTGHLERAHEDIDQHRHRLDVLLHRPGAIDQEADQAIGQRLRAVDAEQAPFGRRADQLRQAAAVDQAFLLRAFPAVDERARQQRPQVTRQP